MVYWINANIFYSGDIYYTIIANGSVHFVMYGYYLASMFKSVDSEGKGTGLIFSLTQAVRPWITSMQLFQFVTMMSQAGYMLYFTCSPNHQFWTKIYFGYILSLFVLFMQFFIENYMKKSNSNNIKAKDPRKKQVASKHPMSTRSRRSAASDKDKTQ